MSGDIAAGSVGQSARASEGRFSWILAVNPSGTKGFRMRAIRMWDIGNAGSDDVVAGDSLSADACGFRVSDRTDAMATAFDCLSSWMVKGSE